MLKRILGHYAVLGTLAISLPAFPATVPFCNTGFLAGCLPDSNANPSALSADGSWYLASGPSGASAGSLFITVNGTFPLDGAHYLLNNSIASWVSPSSNMAVYSAANQSYYYAVQFSLAGFDPLSAAITGSWLSDNDGLGVYLNGVNIAQGSLPAYGGFGGPQVGLSIPAGSGFLAGINTLVFQVNNGPLDGQGGVQPSPAGVRVELSISANLSSDEPIPEPSTLGLMTAGLALALVWRRRA